MELSKYSETQCFLPILTSIQRIGVKDVISDDVESLTLEACQHQIT